MDINVSLPLEQELDLCWHTLGECFEPQELLMKQGLVDKYYPRSKPTTNLTPTNAASTNATSTNAASTKPTLTDAASTKPTP